MSEFVHFIIKNKLVNEFIHHEQIVMIKHQHNSSIKILFLTENLSFTC
jgi:hypothetical protein